MPKKTKTIDRGSRDFYQRNRWRRIAKAWLRAHPLCSACLAVGKITPAVICDHIHGFRENDWTDFITSRDLQSLCASCHNRKTSLQRGSAPARDFQIDIGPDGFPLDPQHPCYRGQPAPNPTRASDPGSMFGNSEHQKPSSPHSEIPSESYSKSDGQDPSELAATAPASTVRSLSCRPRRYRQAREFKILLQACATS